MTESSRFEDLCKIMDTLLGENGCPWDKAQTHDTIRMNTIEESYEVAEAIDNADYAALCDELGDLLFQVIIHARIAEKSGTFTLSEVISQAADKLVRRHTHIFGTDTAASPEEVIDLWEANKTKERAISSPKQNMEAVAKALPALERAQKVIKRSGMEFSEAELKDEIAGLLAMDAQNLETTGKIFFLLAALSTKMQLNAEFSLTNATQAFINNFSEIK